VIDEDVIDRDERRYDRVGGICRGESIDPFELHGMAEMEQSKTAGGHVEVSGDDQGKVRIPQDRFGKLPVKALRLWKIRPR